MRRETTLVFNLGILRKNNFLKSLGLNVEPRPVTKTVKKALVQAQIGLNI